MHKRQDPVSSRWCSLCRSKCAVCSLIQKAGSQVWCELARGLQRRLEPAGTLSASPLTPSNQCAVFHHSHLHATPQTPVTPPCRLTTRSAQPTSLWVPISRCGARSHVSKRHACAAIRLHGYYDRVVLMVCSWLLRRACAPNTRRQAGSSLGCRRRAYTATGRPFTRYAT